MRTINATSTSIHDTNRPINKQQGAVYSFFTLLFFGFPHSLFSSARTIVRNKHPILVPGWNALDNWTRLNPILAQFHFFFFSFRFSIIAIILVQQLFTTQQFLFPLLSLSFSFFFSLFLLATPYCLTRRKLWCETLGKSTRKTGKTN